jgi:sulfite exporter TauE/SafE
LPRAYGSPNCDSDRSPNGPQLAFNAGRISSYGAAGALVGSIGGLGVWIAGALPVQTALFVFANGMLVLVGLHLAGAGRGLVRFEALGAPLWRRLQPLAARVLPAATLPQSFAAGALWGGCPAVSFTAHLRPLPSRAAPVAARS